jgi:NAD(P)-dependent dehydrogenase (short-subunit alcohol dehydrogenase family)
LRAKSTAMTTTATQELSVTGEFWCVNAICPGYIETPLWDQWLANLADPEATMGEVLKAHPLGRTGTPKDVAEAALFLVSEGASFISGTHLVVDGALTAAGH